MALLEILISPIGTWGADYTALVADIVLICMNTELNLITITKERFDHNLTSYQKVEPA
jgi:hypothetical protein